MAGKKVFWETIYWIIVILYVRFHKIPLLYRFDDRYSNQLILSKRIPSINIIYVFYLHYYCLYYFNGINYINSII